MKNILSINILLLMLGCSENGVESKISERWYTQQQIKSGRTVFDMNCAVCHKDNAQGTTDWKKTLPDGSLPPPPLNGSAHAWHHSLSVLRNYIKEGGKPLGGNMPGFNDKLSENEIDSVIAYFQSYWTDDIYELWLGRNGLE
jgi:mono/diheme cytochrome c family protein